MKIIAESLESAKMNRRSFISSLAALPLLRLLPEEKLPPVRRITSGPKFHWFGYYDEWQFDPTGRYVLGCEVDFEHRSPTPDDMIRIGMVDLKDNDRWIEIGATRALIEEITMKNKTQQERIIDILSDGQDHYSKEFYDAYMPRFPARIGELRERGYVIEDKRCDCVNGNKGYKHWKLKEKPLARVIRQMEKEAYQGVLFRSTNQYGH